MLQFTRHYVWFTLSNWETTSDFAMKKNFDSMIKEELDFYFWHYPFFTTRKHVELRPRHLILNNGLMHDYNWLKISFFFANFFLFQTELKTWNHRRGPKALKNISFHQCKNELYFMILYKHPSLSYNVIKILYGWNIFNKCKINKCLSTLQFTV